jgi:FKBP-type peptidyl-prolyl cis-trans isomerase FkpA
LNTTKLEIESMRVRCAWGMWSVALGLALLAGCAGENSPSGQQPVATAPAGAEAPNWAYKPGEMPKLPPGAGTIDEDAPKELTATDSGLRYRILRKADGVVPDATSSVVAHYVGWLDDGSEFDSSYSRGEPTEFPLNGVIRGWTEGLQLIGAGGMIELEIPGDLAYGPDGRPGIPPNATLHFLVELKKVR